MLEPIAFHAIMLSLLALPVPAVSPVVDATTYTQRLRVLNFAALIAIITPAPPVPHRSVALAVNRGSLPTPRHLF
ncbi:hypothetical protein AX14_008284 [Amanita brunnescens Koide BX004]|nr:hypothetical protein AX14_008284 [Amanita brunnescens Koide BX004]